jgi:hypothetical protein
MQLSRILALRAIRLRATIRSLSVQSGIAAAMKAKAAELRG